MLRQTFVNAVKVSGFIVVVCSIFWLPYLTWLSLNWYNEALAEVSSFVAFFVTICILAGAAGAVLTKIQKDSD